MQFKKIMAVLCACFGGFGGVVGVANAQAPASASAAAAAAAAAAAPVLAPVPWLTVVGDAADASLDTIEVDPVAISTSGAERSMRIRVSRTRERTSTDGVVFTSYRAVVLFDCGKRSARFLSADFFRAPLWQGEAHESIVYASNLPRPMVFRGIEPNPLQRIIRAACQIPGGDKK